MQRILVTGGAGFLGSHLCERLLDEGHHVICLDDLSTGSRDNVRRMEREPRFEMHRQDVAQPFTATVDCIYHLACPASPVHYQRDAVRTIRTAVQGTLSVLELARQTGARVLVASTSEVYGDPQEHPQRESYWGHVNPIGARACYDEGKRCAEALTMAYAAQQGVQTRIARIFNTYGPRMREDDGRVVSSFVVQALRGEPLTIFGTGQQTRSFCFVGDLIDGLVRLMRCDADPGPVNLGNPEELTIAALADLVRALAGARVPVRHAPLPSDDPVRRRPDITKAGEVLGWRPLVPVRAGLRATIEHFRRQLAGRAPENVSPSDPQTHPQHDSQVDPKTGPRHALAGGSGTWTARSRCH